MKALPRQMPPRQVTSVGSPGEQQSEFITAIRETTKVKPDGTIELRLAVLAGGEEVEVIVLVPQKRENRQEEPYAFLKVLEDANLDGPPDWSENLEEYLHHGKRL